MDEMLKKSFRQLSKDANDFYLMDGISITNSITPVKFLQAVSANLPILIKGGIAHYPACQKWNANYFRETLSDKVITVAVTPTGYADAIAETPAGEAFFVEPEERQMTMSNFLDILDNPGTNQGVFYIQKQNSNLINEFPELLNDIEKEVPFASEALGAPPSALNFWMGDCRAVTSMHKDPFENIYCVIKGMKEFILHPPTDRPWIPYKFYPTARYHEDDSGNFQIIAEEKDPFNPIFCDSTDDVLCICGDNSCSRDCDEARKVPWVSIDPLKPDLKKYPLYQNTTQISVQVLPGDILYIPALWFHHVRQSHGCIAINYWYDMNFDIKFVYFKFLESLLPALCESEKTKSSVTEEKETRNGSGVDLNMGDVM